MDTKIIKEKLKELAEKDRDLTVFGSRKHCYQSFPVPLKEINKFEQKFQFQLPKNFKIFLTEIGFGAGPYYGIYNLREISEYVENWFKVDYFISPIEWAFWAIGNNPKNPFNSKRKNHPELNFSITESDIEKFKKDFLKDDESRIPFQTYKNGNIRVCNAGCHYEYILATSGELKGSIWHIEWDGENTNLAPALLASKDKTIEITSFEKWYEDWLDYNLSRIVKK